MIKAIKNFVKRFLESQGYCISFGEPATFAGILSAFHRRTSDFFFIQIGAYDGKESDPLRQFIHQRSCRGLLVEPQQRAFEKLLQNYSGCPGLKFENIAIADRKGFLPFYQLKNEFAHLYRGDHGALASFDPGHIIKHLSKPVDASQALTTTEVPCLSIMELFDKHRIKSIDLLQIDAEGYDFKIIKTLEFRTLKPNIIRLEHAHIQQGDKIECIELLLSHGYKLVIGAYDITAFQSRYMYD